jgi:hypothetical protein
MADLTFLWGGKPFEADPPDGVASTPDEQLAQGDAPSRDRAAV